MSRLGHDAVTLTDLIARIEARGVKLPEMNHWFTVGWNPGEAISELLTALDKATEKNSGPVLDRRTAARGSPA